MGKQRGRERSSDRAAHAIGPSVGLWGARGLLLAALFWAYAPSLRFQPIGLDDAGQLASAAGQTLGQVWDVDRYGHFRPIKSALFWLWSRPETHWVAVRAALLAVLMLATLLVERLAARVMAGSAQAGLMVAACWALHPVLPASVCWLSAVHGVLCLIGLLVYLECAERSIGSPRAWAWLALALASLAFTLLSHQLAVVAPLLLWLRHSLSSTPSAATPARAYASSAALVALFVLLLLTTSSPLAHYRAAEQPAWLMSASAARYVFHHALWWLIPATHFGVLLTDRPEAQLALSAVGWLGLIGACALSWKLRRREPRIVFGLAWFLITIAPFANFVPIGNTPLGMHYLAVPSVGLAISGVQALRLLVERFPRARLLPPLLVMALIAYFLPTTKRAVAAFGSEAKLFEQTVANHPDQIEPLVNLAAAQLARGQLTQAAATLERARQLDPENTGVLRNRFALHWQKGELQAALALLDSHPRIAARPEFQLGRGQALLRLGRHVEAINPLQSAYDSNSAEISAEQRLVAGMQLVLALLQSQREAEAQRLSARMRAEYPNREELRAMDALWRK